MAAFSVAHYESPWLNLWNSYDVSYDFLVKNPQVQGLWELQKLKHLLVRVHTFPCGRTNEWMNERLNEWMHEWRSHTIKSWIDPKGDWKHHVSWDGFWMAFGSFSARVGAQVGGQIWGKSAPKSEEMGDQDDVQKTNIKTLDSAYHQRIVS